MPFLRPSGPLLVLGSLNLDLVLAAERIPCAGETVQGLGYAEFCGGKGANQAVAAARLGAPVRLIGRLGSDSFGQRLQAALQDAGVDTSAVEVVPGPSGLAFITRSPQGENSIVVLPGANALLTAEALDFYQPLFASAAALLLQLETPLPTVVAAAALAHAAGTPVVLDPAPACDLPAELLAHVDWLTPNETEAATLLHCPSGSLHPESAAGRLLALGPRNVALKLGTRGVFLAGQDCAPIHVPAFPVQAVDTTAAGDCFNAAFAVGLRSGLKPAAAARQANAAAALSVTRPGAQDSLPSAAELQAFLRAHP